MARRFHFEIHYVFEFGDDLQEELAAVSVATTLMAVDYPSAQSGRSFATQDHNSFPVYIGVIEVEHTSIQFAAGQRQSSGDSWIRSPVIEPSFRERGRETQ
jgi:hypothetical protein